MRLAWHDVWGSALGPVARLAPQTRILAGAATFAACMVAPVDTGRGAAVAASICVAWLAACRPPARAVRSAILLGLALFLPYFALTPLLEAGPGAGPLGVFAVPWSLFARGVCGLVVSTAAIATLTASDLREGLLRLPIPRVISAILLQIVVQTASLGAEAQRIAAAMAVRAASSRGRTAWRVLSSLPQVWIPRVVQRADRVAAAMELRGYCVQPLGAARLRVRDAVALALAVLLLCVAAFTRWSLT
jgi:energy-coupling factor transporter transmembrane protein EcfT